MTLQAYLDSIENEFDDHASLVSAPFSGAGYHSRLASGSVVHPIRESITYAAYLLMDGGPVRVERANRVIEKVLSFQDNDSTSRTYGIWPYTAEEPLEEMNPPDWNWADFTGSLIGLILHGHADDLRPDVRGKLRAGLRAAAMAIFRRNVQPEYTNIAIMGAGVTLLAGELLPDPFLLSYGRKRLEQNKAHVARHGDFAEYNSPTYTFVALEELSRILHAIRDPSSREVASYLAEHAWRIIAEGFHPRTGQIAGPHSRAYSERLSRRTVGTIEAGTDMPIHFEDPGELETGRKMPGTAPALVPIAPCPRNLRHYFSAEAGGSPDVLRTVRRTIMKGIYSGDDMASTTWIGRTATLGTVNADSSWVQRHPLIAYWRNDAPVCTTLLLQVQKDGRDFASFMIRTAQAGSSALVGLTPLMNGGDWHLYLDHPRNHEFTFADLRVSFVVSGPNRPRVSSVGDGFEVEADGVSAIVHPAGGAFCGREIEWGSDSHLHSASVYAVLYSGNPITVDFSRLNDTWIAAALAVVDAKPGILSDDSLAHPVGIATETVGDNVELFWAAKGLNLSVPTQSERYPLDPSIWKQG